MDSYLCKKYSSKGYLKKHMIKIHDIRECPTLQEIYDKILNNKLLDEEMRFRLIHNFDKNIYYPYVKLLYDNLYNDDMVKKIGENINKKLEFKDMQNIYYITLHASSNNKKDYEYAKCIKYTWNGIGHWLT